MGAKARLKVVVEDSHGEPFLIMGIRDAISREVANFLDLVPSKDEALRLLMDAIDNGFRLKDARDGRRA